VHTDASGGQELAFTSSTSAFQVQAGDMMANAFLGNFANPSFNADANSLASTAWGDNASNGAVGGAVVTFTGAGMTSPVSLTLNAGDTTVAATVADLNTQIAGNAALTAAGFSVSGSAGHSLIFSSSRGLYYYMGITGDTNNHLGFGAYTSGATGTAQGGALGVTTATTGHLYFSFGGGASNTNSLAVTTGAGDTIAEVVNEVNQAIATSANANIQAAQLQAQNVGGKLAIVSGNGTAFNITEDNGNGGSLGFGTVSADNNFTEVSTVNFHAIDSGGAASLTTTATGTVNPAQALSFTGLLGGTTQGITISANDSNGDMQSKTITLNASNASTVDQAVSQINTVLQETDNPTLQNIVAVKENVSGVEKINFLSSAQAFQVAVGSTTTGQGINGGTAANVSGSIATGTGSTISIDTQQGALDAVTAIENAVNKLGSAQSAVGRGENLLNYAQNLAQSQITNFSAAQSRIRDADIAAEAANLTQAQVLQQASIAAMAQANSAPQAILKLLQ
jgi:flagellin